MLVVKKDFSKGPALTRFFFCKSGSASTESFTKNFKRKGAGLQLNVFGRMCRVFLTSKYVMLSKCFVIRVFRENKLMLTFDTLRTR